MPSAHAAPHADPFLRPFGASYEDAAFHGFRGGRSLRDGLAAPPVATGRGPSGAEAPRR